MKQTIEEDKEPEKSGGYPGPPGPYFFSVVLWSVFLLNLLLWLNLWACSVICCREAVVRQEEQEEEEEAAL